jgi:hypothetical protein
MSSCIDSEPCLFVYPYITTTPLLPRYSSQHSNRRGKRRKRLYESADDRNSHLAEV